MTDHDMLIQHLWNTAKSCDRPAAAAEQFASVAKLAESFYGLDHEKTLFIRDSWVDCLQDAGEHSAAILCYEENLRRRLRSKSFGKDHESTLEIRRLLADSYEANNQQEKAVEQYREVIKRGEELHDHTELFKDVVTAACMLVDWGQETGNQDKIADAREMTTKYYQKAQKEFPKGHESLLDLAYNIGFQLGALGRHSEAIKQFQGVIKQIAESKPNSRNQELLKHCETQYAKCERSLERAERTKNESGAATGRQGVNSQTPALKIPNPANSKDSWIEQWIEEKENDEVSSSTQLPKALISGFTRTPTHESKPETTTNGEHSPFVKPKLLDSENNTQRSRFTFNTSSLSPAEPFLQPASAASFPKPDAAQKDLHHGLEAIRADEHPSSVGNRKLQNCQFAKRGDQFFESNTEDESERWFIQLQNNAHQFLGKYYQSNQRVEIALLDTGVALKNPSAVEMSDEIKLDLSDQVVRGKRLQNNLPGDKDVDGHGSECAYLLTRVTPFARIISYRIVETRNDHIKPVVVAEALQDAIERQVDIISMSFGCKPTPEIRNLMNAAKGKGILMFAATSNDGGPTIKFPAYSDEVFAIDAAKRTGGLSSDNPGATFVKPHRFTALGEILSLKGSIYGNARRPERKTGSSFATPIAAATAALILEFANQPPLAYDPLAVKELKMLEGMRAVLIQLFSTKKSTHSEFNHINIEHFKPMNDREQWDDGGDCDDWTSDRYQAAEMICNVLRTTFDEDVGNAMRAKVSEITWGIKLAEERRERQEINRENWEKLQRDMNDMIDKHKISDWPG